MHQVNPKKRRICVEYRRINKLQPEVTKADGGKGCISLIPLPKIAQAPAYFQKIINDILKGCNFAMGYLDNIIIYSRSEKEHLEHLEEIFSRLRAAGLKLKMEKCCFFKKHIQYLGHLIFTEGIQPLPEKLESIAKMPPPKNRKRSDTIFRTSRILQKVHTQVCRHRKSVNTSH